MSATQSLFGRFGGKLTIDEVGSRPGVAITHRCANALASASALKLPFVHQSRQPIIANRYSVVFEFGLDSGTPVRVARTSVDGFDAIAQRNVALFARGRRTKEPRIVPAGGDPKRTAHRGNTVLGLIALHESEGLFGSVSVSRANQAAAFDKISRSIVSCFTFLRNMKSSVRSSLVRPSVRLPASRSACLIQLRIV